MEFTCWKSPGLLPEVIAGQTDVRPAHRRKVRKQCRIERRADSVEVLGGPVEIDRVPVGNRRNQQVQPRCAKFLIFQRAIGEPTLPVGIDGGGKRVPRLAFVEDQRAIGTPFVG